MAAPACPLLDRAVVAQIEGAAPARAVDPAVSWPRRGGGRGRAVRERPGGFGAM